MNHADLPKRLSELANLAAFARASGLPRRTLVRIASGQANPMLATCEAIVEALRKHRPPKRRAEEEAG